MTRVCPSTEYPCQGQPGGYPDGGYPTLGSPPCWTWPGGTLIGGTPLWVPPHQTCRNSETRNRSSFNLKYSAQCLHILVADPALFELFSPKTAWKWKQLGASLAPPPPGYCQCISSKRKKRKIMYFECEYLLYKKLRNFSPNKKQEMSVCQNLAENNGKVLWRRLCQVVYSRGLLMFVHVSIAAFQISATPAKRVPRVKCIMSSFNINISCYINFQKKDHCHTCHVKIGLGNG